MKMTDLRQRLLAASTIDLTDTLLDSRVVDKGEIVPTSYPIVNLLLSGKLDGGLTPGVTMIAGKSKTFKTGFSIMLADAYLKHYDDAMVLFYDCEFGALQLFKAFGVPRDRIIHTPITDLEELLHDIVVQINALKRGDHCFIMVDSIGNLASRKEAEDAEKNKIVNDPGQRVKRIKSLMRIICPKANLKHIPVVLINHTYGTMELYSQEVVSGGSGPYYTADNIWVVRQNQHKKGDEVIGSDFIIKVEKSRFVRERSKVVVPVTFDEWIYRWAGFLDVALEGGYVCKPEKGKYAEVDRTTGEVKDKKYKEDDITNNEAFWTRILETTDFGSYLEKKFVLPETTNANS